MTSSLSRALISGTPGPQRVRSGEGTWPDRPTRTWRSSLAPCSNPYCHNVMRPHEETPGGDPMNPHRPHSSDRLHVIQSINTPGIRITLPQPCCRRAECTAAAVHPLLLCAVLHCALRCAALRSDVLLCAVLLCALLCCVALRSAVALRCGSPPSRSTRACVRPLPPRPLPRPPVPAPPTAPCEDAPATAPFGDAPPLALQSRSSKGRLEPRVIKVRPWVNCRRTAESVMEGTPS